MELQYRQYSKYDCTKFEIKKGKILILKALPEKLPDSSWIKLLAFFDEKEEELVFVPYNSKIKIGTKKYEIFQGEFFIIREFEEKALNNPKYLFQKDLCIQDSSGKKHCLREFIGKEVEFISKPF